MEREAPKQQNVLDALREKTAIASKILLQPENRKELVDYYKWTVNLATFILTLSLSLTSVLTKAQDLKHKSLLITGWILLGLCIFMNWLLVKRFITMPIIEQTPEEERGFMAGIMRASFLGNIKSYGFLQNWASFGDVCGNCWIHSESLLKPRESETFVI